jgi:DNA polymerase elongation subunit (family B)
LIIQAIRIIDSTKKWGAKVVYGDTDSLFIYLRGKTKQQAFRIGNDIADSITAMNPAPVKLKFEKVSSASSFWFNTFGLTDIGIFAVPFNGKETLRRL